MPKHRNHSTEFKRQVAQEFLAGETLNSLGRRHDLRRNLIRIWVGKFETGEFDDDAHAANLLQQYEARIAALECLVGKQALELENSNSVASILSSNLDLAAPAQEKGVRIPTIPCQRRLKSDPLRRISPVEI